MTMTLYRNIKNVSGPDSAIFVAQNTGHIRDWKLEGIANGLEELTMLRAYRHKTGYFRALQRRGYWKVEFTLRDLKDGGATNDNPKQPE